MITNLIQSIPDSLFNEIWGVLGALIILIISQIIRAKAKLTYGRANNSRNVVFTTNQEDSEESTPHEIYVEKYFIQNAGRATATKVEFVLSSKPTDIAIYPATTIEQQFVGHGEWHISIPQIAPGELVIVTCLYINQSAAWVSSVKSAETVGNEVQFFTQRNYGKLLTTIVAALMFFGVAFILSVLARLVL